jgi:hypothetical protein
MWLQTLSKVDSTTLTNGADRVRQQTRPLAGAALGELDSLLRERQDRLSIRQTWTMLGAGVGVLLLGALLALLLPAPPRSAPVEAGVDEREEIGPHGGGDMRGGDMRGAGMRGGDMRRGDPGRRDMRGGGIGVGETTLVDPLDQDSVDELLHVGRAVRAHRRERVGDVR